MVEPRLSAAQAKQLLDAGEAFALDVTSTLVYPAVSRRIPGAIRVAPEPILRGIERAAPVAQIASHFGDLPDGKSIIAYCT